MLWLISFKDWSTLFYFALENERTRVTCKTCESEALLKDLHTTHVLSFPKANKTGVVRRQRSSPRGNQIWKATSSVCDSKFKVKVTRSKIMLWCERFCHKEYTCEIWKPYLSWFINYDQGESFWKVGQHSRSRSLGKKLWYDVKGPITMNTHVK